MIKLTQSRCISSLKIFRSVSWQRISSAVTQPKLQTIKLKFYYKVARITVHIQVPATKIRALMGKEWDPETWRGDVWEDTIEARTLNPQNLKGFANLRK